MIVFAGLVARSITFTAVMAVIGAVVFRLIVIQRAGLRPETAARAARRAATLGAIAAAAIIPAAIARLVVQTAEMRFPGDPWVSVAMRLVTASKSGHVWMAQVGACLLLVPAFVAARNGNAARWIPPVLLGAVLASTPALSSHAMTAHRLAGISVVADVLHVTGAAAWLGTLGVMFASIRGGDGAADGEVHYVLALLRAFSPLALGCAALVLTSGLLSSLAHVLSPSVLVSTRYGVTLLAKVAVVLVVLLLGWRNWRRLTPAVHRDGLAAIRRGMAAELFTVVIVLVITAALVVTSPPMEGMP